MKTEQKQELVGGLAWGIGIVILALTATFVRKLGYLDSETARRLVTGANGLVVAWMGNRMPKAFVPSACARRIRHVGGWSLFLSGLAYAGLWAFAPISVAVPVGIGAILVGMSVTVVYCLALRAKMKPTA